MEQNAEIHKQVFHFSWEKSHFKNSWCAYEWFQESYFCLLFFFKDMFYFLSLILACIIITLVSMNVALPIFFLYFNGVLFSFSLYQ